MPIAISALPGDVRRLALSADEFSGHPDGQTSLDEIDAYLPEKPLRGPPIFAAGDRDQWDLRVLRRILKEKEVDARATLMMEAGARITPERRSALVSLAVELAEWLPRWSFSVVRHVEFDRTYAWLRQHGVTNENERAWVMRLAEVAAESSKRSGQAFDEMLKDAEADGVLSPDERAQIVQAAGKLATEMGRAKKEGRDDVPGAADVIVAYAVRKAENGATSYKNLYRVAVHTGVVPDASPLAPALPPPSAQTVASMRNGSIPKKITDAQNEATDKILANHHSGVANRLWENYNINAIADELVRKWNDDPLSKTSSQAVVERLLYNNFQCLNDDFMDRMYRRYDPASSLSSKLSSSFSRPNCPEPIKSAKVRAALAAAIVSRLSDAQLAALSEDTTRTLMGALSGGGLVTGMYMDSSRPTMVTYVVKSADGGVRKDEIRRLLNASSLCFVWLKYIPLRPGEYPMPWQPRYEYFRSPPSEP